jgi:hypothetical protein
MPPRLGAPGPAESQKVGSVPFFPLMYVKGPSFPSWSEITYVGRSALGDSFGGPAPVWGCFSLRPPTIAPTCWETMSQSGGVERREDEEGRVASLSAPPSSEDPDLWGSPPPVVSLPHQWHADLSLSQRQCLLIGGAFHLQIFSILMQISTPRLTMATPKPLCKIVSTVKR